MALRAKARYMAPVSRLRRPKCWARCRATVLLPAAAGPSMAMIGPRVIRGSLPDYDFCADFVRRESMCGNCFEVYRDAGGEGRGRGRWVCRQRIFQVERGARRCLGERSPVPMRGGVCRERVGLLRICAVQT